MRRLYSLVLVLVLVLVLGPNRAALAQDGHGHEKPPEHGAKDGGEHPRDPHAAAAPGEHHGYHPPRLDAIGVQLLGFVILAIILGKFAVPPAIHALRARSDRIRAELDALDRGEKAVADAKAAAEKGLSEIERTSLERSEQAVKEGAALRRQLVAEGDEGAEKVRYKAKLEVEIERQKMILELRNEVVEMSLDAAARMLRGNIDAATQEKLVDKFIDELETVAGA